MKRRSFLKALTGAAAGVALAPVIKHLPAKPVFEPGALPYLVSNDTGLFQSISRSMYPELNAPVLDVAGPPIRWSDFEAVKNRLLNRVGSESGE